MTVDSDEAAAGLRNYAKARASAAERLGKIALFCGIFAGEMLMQNVSVYFSLKNDVLRYDITNQYVSVGRSISVDELLRTNEDLISYARREAVSVRSHVLGGAWDVKT